MASRPKLQISFKERDLGMGHFLREAAKIRKKPYVKVGVTQAKNSKLREDEKITNADLAQIHEFGAPNANIPERSFIRSTKDKNEAKYNKHIEILKDQIFNADSGMTTERALALIGQEVSADIKNTIRAGIPPALKQSTVFEKNKAQIAKAESTLRGLEKKGKLSKADIQRQNKASDTVLTGGKSTPLIDTGQLINSISYEVVLDGNSEKGKEGSSI